MKILLRKIASTFLDKFVFLWVLCRLKYYRLINASKSKMLIYTDSRGYEIRSRLNKKNPFSSCYGDFIKSYCVDAYICPEKHTTLVDFLYLVEKTKKKYDVIILHCGVVDFSSRKKSSVYDIHTYKKERFNLIGFSDVDFFESYEKKTECLYEGEETASLYTIDQFKELILNRLRGFDNLIWVGCNRVLDGWRGSYWKDRPSDINIIMEYTKIAEDALPAVVSLSSWNEEIIRKYTEDNIHPNQQGFNYIKGELLKLILPILQGGAHNC